MTSTQKASDEVNSSIVVIDDDPDVLFATSRVLERAGYKVIQGSTGAQAICLARETRPDLVLLDAILPDISGIDVMTSLKKDMVTQSIPVILISSMKIGSEDQSSGLEKGADDYIARPISNRELLARIHAFLRIRSMERELARYRSRLEEMVASKTETLRREIKKKERVQQLLKQQKRWVSLNNEMASIFLTLEPEQVYLEVTRLLIKTFGCKYACVGYINQYGDLVCPALDSRTWPSEDNTENAKIYQHTQWSGIWARAIRENRVSINNSKTRVFSSSVRFENALAAPLFAGGRCVGLVGLADHPKGFTPENQKRMEMICRFVAPVLSMFIQREKSKKELREHARKLEQKNIALNVLLETREEGKKKLSDEVVKNFDRLVFPYYERINTCRQKKELDILLTILEKNTWESLAPLERRIPARYRQFTPIEIQVADLIKLGKTSKEISALLKISLRSVFFHRNNIRKKLNIVGQKANLRTNLLS